MRRFFKNFCAVVLFYLAPYAVFAHEVYVLTPAEFQAGLAYRGFDLTAAFESADNLKTFLVIGAIVTVLLILNFFFQRSRTGRAFQSFIERGQRFGPFIVRLAVSASFFFSALEWSFLGPELALAALPFAEVLRVALFALSGLFLLGLFTEIAAFVALGIYTIATWKFGLYLATYFNYVGELVVLFLLGFRYFSLDGLLFGPKKSFSFLKQYETTIVRICYGIALCYVAISVKFLHPAVMEIVVNKYNLTQFHWLFPSDPRLVTLGAALAELFLGLCIIFGFELRLMVLVTLFYITLSLIFFKELVWPHLMLYGISLSLLFNKETFTLDGLFEKHVKKFRN